MRVAMGRLWQESAGFSPVLTKLENFEVMGIYYGGEIFERFTNVIEIGGFIEAARTEKDVELIPTMSAGAVPSGRCDRKTHQFLKGRFLEELRKAGRLDGILLALHGAMTAQDVYDVEGDLLEAIRMEWGHDIPMVISLDHHANVTKQIIKSINALVGYHTAPHIDMFETGFKAAKILFATIRGEVKPTMGWRKIPMIVGANTLVPQGPLGEFFEEAKRLEKTEKVLAVSIFPEFCYTDYPELGCTTVVVTDNAPDLAQKIADL